MTAEYPATDRAKSPLLDTDYDTVRIADALLTSPHTSLPLGWDRQDIPLRQHAQAVPRALTR
ncbi:hypothetical protein ACWEWI_39815 [Streptomyces sp. NPDC003753]